MPLYTNGDVSSCKYTLPADVILFLHNDKMPTLKKQDHHQHHTTTKARNDLYRALYVIAL
jgi:hypothetical protein